MVETAIIQKLDGMRSSGCVAGKRERSPDSDSDDVEADDRSDPDGRVSRPRSACAPTQPGAPKQESAVAVGTLGARYRMPRINEWTREESKSLLFR
jgi:hypothetical protein